MGCLDLDNFVIGNIGGEKLRDKKVEVCRNGDGVKEGWIDNEERVQELQDFSNDVWNWTITWFWN